jgi:hypothetical protein
VVDVKIGPHNKQSTSPLAPARKRRIIFYPAVTQMADIHIAPCASDLSLAALLSTVFSCTTRSACLSLLGETKKKKGTDKITAKQRQSLCQLAGLEHAWIVCDQKILHNVEDLASQICSELYDPFVFYTRTLRQTNDNNDSVSISQEATVPLKWNKREKFWAARNRMDVYPWLPPRSDTYDATVHFIQEGSGTGVHVGNGIILTCAHVSQVHSCQCSTKSH